MSVYDLIMQEKWDDAIEQASINYENTNDILQLRNLIPALLVKNKNTNVLRVVDEIWKSNDRESDTEFINAAIANIGLGNTEESINLLKDSRNCKYSDPTGGVEVESMIYAISTIVNDEKELIDAIKRIKKILIKKGNKQIWPGPIGLFMIGKIEFDELLASLSRIDTLTKKQSCQAYFYKAIKEYEKGLIKECLTSLEKCREYTPQGYFKNEYHLSVALEKMINMQ